MVVWLGTAAIVGLLHCVERSLTSFTDGHTVFGPLYLVPAALLIRVIARWICLAGSFYQAVVR